MTSISITDADRDPQGNIMLEAERRAAERNPPPAEAPAAPETPPEAAGESPPEAPRPVRAISPSAWVLRGGDGKAIPAPRHITIAGALCGLLAVLALVLLMGRPPAAPRATPTAQPTIAPSPAPSALPERTDGSLARAVVAYAAPDGTVLGSIEPGRGFVLVGRYGEGWVQLDVRGSGRVWVRRGEVPLDAMDMEILAALPDLAPPPTATAAPPSTAAPIVAQPPPTTEPEVCVRTDYGSRCGPASEMADEERIAATIATESKAWSESWLATATAEARP